MNAAAATLYAVSGILEAGGIAVTVADIHNARGRLRDFIRSPRHVYATDAVGIGEAFDARVVTDEVKTLEQRVEDLEAWKRSVPDELDRRDQQLTTRLETRLQSDLEATRQSVQTQLIQVREYLQGALQKATVSYRGPAALLVGVLVGTAANFVALTSG
ncbi:hypothetical protein [Streptomyces lunaelactis]|uniref:hypothetical protein n=1 Tax=Streptomyces lunaelactis TaxID=1535768 RepID=UPI0015853C41|nr:hypothetical protein [Streptomyces lunaelactis]NUL24941.1 hypothetical protein [Streptomyces lunaelactis]